MPYNYEKSSKNNGKTNSYTLKNKFIYLNHELPNVCIAFPCATASRYLVYKHMHT